MRVLPPLVASAAIMSSVAPAAVARGTIDPCDGVSRCHVVAAVDVNGNGTPNAVGLQRRGRAGTASAEVVVRVAVDGHVATLRRPTPYWSARVPLWQGAANVDGRPGKELFVGRTYGAHTIFFTGVSYRQGRLVEREAPGRGDGSWVVDAAYSVAIGWQRSADDPKGLVRYRQALRNGQRNTFTAVVKTFRWRQGSWVRTSLHRYPMLSERRAYSWGGFHIRGLERF